MLALWDIPLGKALFVFPVLDMNCLTRHMMGWANVTKTELEKQGEIPTNWGETLSWRYLQYAREHPIHYP